MINEFLDEVRQQDKKKELEEALKLFPMLNISEKNEEMKVNESEVNSEKCQICLNYPSKYTCPKCKIKYCSLKCYSNELHSKCNEKFAKQNIDDNLKKKIKDKASI